MTKNIKSTYEEAVEYYNQEDYVVEQAIEKFKVAISNGYIAAYYDLSVLYNSHSKLKGSKKLAFEYMQKAADNNYQEAYYVLANMYLDREYGHFSKTKAILYFIKSGETDKNTINIIKKCLWIIDKKTIHSDFKILKKYVVKASKWVKLAQDDVLKKLLGYFRNKWIIQLYVSDVNSNTNYERLFKKISLDNYATNKYDFLRFVSPIEEKNNIYYIADYYPKRNKDISNQSRLLYETFIRIKNGTYDFDFIKQKYVINFPNKIEAFLNRLSGEWIICTVPGHNESSNLYKNISNIAKLLDMKEYDPRFSRINDLIFRAKESTPKHLQDHRDNDFREDLKTLEISDKYDIRNKDIIVVDDITTSGATLIACKVLLKKYGAKEVVLLALGKTKSI